MNLLEIKNLTKQFGKFTALDNINLTIPRGTIIGLLGKNGAGKSTLMKSILGFLKHSGDITLNNIPIKDYKHNVFEHIAFIPDVDGLDNKLTVRQAINFVAGINKNWKDATAQNLLDKSNLPLDKKISKLSKGMKTKLYLLLVLSLDVELLLLDEPTLGLDIAFRKEFFNTILGEFYDESKTIIISTHQVEEVEHILQEIIFIDRGKILLHENIEELKNRFDAVTVSMDRREELMQYQPKLISHTLGAISGIIKSGSDIPDATYTRPLLADLFLAELGGYNE